MHSHHLAGVMDGNIQSVAAMCGKFAFDARLLTDQDDRDAPLPGRHNGTGNFRARGMVAPHGVNSDDDATVQSGRPLFFRRADFLALIGSTGSTGAMRLLGFLALRADRYARSLQGIMGTTHITF